MRAAVHNGYGPPEVVRIARIDEPVPKDDELLVRVRATTVNRTDCGYRAGKPYVVRFFGGWPRPKVAVWGTEFAGEVESVGSGVTSFQVGDRVFGYTEGSFGGHAEYMTIRADGVVTTMPGDLTFEEAAPAAEGSHYALAFIKKAKIRSGQDVLVNGATGGIGSAAVQLLKDLGARVTAVCGTANIALVEGLGADRVIDYETVDFTKDEQRFDVVFDAVGKSSFGRTKGLLKPGGVYMSSELGPYGQNPFLALVSPVLPGKKVYFPIPKQDRDLMDHLKGLIESGAYKPVVDRHYPLNEIVEAYRYVESGQKIGNVVVTVDR